MQQGKLPIYSNPTLHWQCHYTVFYKVTKTTCSLLKVLVPIQKNIKQENNCSKIFLIGITTLPSNALMYKIMTEMIRTLNRIEDSESRKKLNEFNRSSLYWNPNGCVLQSGLLVFKRSRMGSRLGSRKGGPRFVNPHLHKCFYNLYRNTEKCFLFALLNSLLKTIKNINLLILITFIQILILS
jgi:hypothetical protein